MATPESVRAPDVAGEILGFRAWRVMPHGHRGQQRLHSIFEDGPWPPRAWMVAGCSFCDDPPNEKCTCGIYAARDAEHLDELGYNAREEPLAIGEVALAGKVIVGEKGWRAEKARPIRLFLPYECWELVKPLAAAYRIPVGLTNVLRHA